MKRRRRILIVLAVVVLLVAAGAGVWESSLLKLRRVSVVGNHHTTVAQVVGAAALVPGTRLTRISSAQVQSRVGTLPWVASVSVARLLPSQIRITITERVPVAVVQGQGHSYLVDSTGAVLQDAGQNPAGYPVLSGLPLTAIVPGERITAPAFASAVAVLEALPRTLRAALASLRAPAANQITVALTDQTVILYGDASALSAKNYDVQTLLANGGSFVSIDVSAPDHPAAIPG